jgi:hypothetical protein
MQAGKNSTIGTGDANNPEGSGVSLTALRDRANKAIDNRIQTLNAQLTRLGQMTRLTDAQKTALRTSEQAVITDLTGLKTKIATDTDLATLKTDIASITRSERVYLLVIPQAAILSAADRINTVATMLSGIQAKLASRVLTLPAGTDATALNSSLSDMQTQITNAVTASQNASSAIASLRPDNGVQTTLTANNKALKNARVQIATAQKELQTAQKDAKTVLQSLKSLLPVATHPTNQ